MAILASLVWAPISADANYTIDLIWADSGSLHIDIMGPGDPTATTGGTLCHSDVRSSAGSGSCRLIQLTALVPTVPGFASTGGCLPSCDSARGSFGGGAAGLEVAGVYIIGSINLDLSGTMGLNPDPLLLTFLRAGVDGVTDKKHNFAPVHLNHATLFVAPEPGSAGLLGLGVLALACFGRTRKAYATRRRAARIGDRRYTTCP